MRSLSCITLTVLSLVGLFTSMASAGESLGVFGIVHKYDQKEWRPSNSITNTTSNWIHGYTAALGGLPPSALFGPGDQTNGGTEFASTFYPGSPNYGKNPGTVILIGYDPLQNSGISGQAGILPIAPPLSLGGDDVLTLGGPIDVTIQDNSLSGSTDPTGMHQDNHQSGIGSNGSIVPAPGGIALLIGAFLCSRRRRRSPMTEI